MAADVAPGLLRLEGSMPTGWPGFDVDAWKSLQIDAIEREARGRATLRACIHGSDSDPHAIRAARENAQVAGVADAIRLGVCDVASLPAQENPHGVVVCNPPYDARLAADPALYRALGEALKRAAPGWTASLLCGDFELARATGVRAQKRYQMFNGPIECSLIVCDADRAARPW